jgi:molecular chaperone HtpG
MPDEENKILSISNTSVGMTKADMVNNLETIAKSGRKVYFFSSFHLGALIYMRGLHQGLWKP